MKLKYFLGLLLLSCANQQPVGDREIASLTEPSTKFVVYKDQVFSVHSCPEFKKKRFDHHWSQPAVPNYSSNKLKSQIAIASDQCAVNPDFEVVLDHTGQIKSSLIEKRGLKLSPSPLGSPVFGLGESVLNEEKFSPKVYQNIFLSTQTNPTY